MEESPDGDLADARARLAAVRAALDELEAEFEQMGDHLYRFEVIRILRSRILPILGDG